MSGSGLCVSGNNKDVLVVLGNGRRRLLPDAYSQSKKRSEHMLRPLFRCDSNVLCGECAQALSATKRTALENVSAVGQR